MALSGSPSGGRGPSNLPDTSSSTSSSPMVPLISLFKRKVAAADKLMSALAAKDEERTKAVEKVEAEKRVLEEEAAVMRERLEARDREVEEERRRWEEKLSEEKNKLVEVYSTRLLSLEGKLREAEEERAQLRRENARLQEFSDVRELAEDVRMMEKFIDAKEEEDEDVKSDDSRETLKEEEQKNKEDAKETLSVCKKGAAALHAGDTSSIVEAEGGREGLPVPAKEAKEGPPQLTPSERLLKDRQEELQQMEEEATRAGIVVPPPSILPKQAGKKVKEVPQLKDTPRMEAVAIPRKQSPGKQPERIAEAVKRLKEGRNKVDSVKKRMAAGLQGAPKTFQGEKREAPASAFLLGSRSGAAKRHMLCQDNKPGLPASKQAKVEESGKVKEAKEANQAGKSPRVQSSCPKESSNEVSWDSNCQELTRDRDVAAGRDGTITDSVAGLQVVVNIREKQDSDPLVEAGKQHSGEDEGETMQEIPITSSLLIESTFLETAYKSYQEQHAVKKAALARRKEGCAKNRDRDLNISTIKVQLGRLWKSVRTSDEMASIARNLDRPDFSRHHERILFAILFKVIRDEKLKEEGLERKVRVRTGRREEGEQQEPSPYGLTVKQKKVLSLLDWLTRNSEHLKSVVPRFATYLYYSIFEGDRLYNMKGFQARNVVTMYLCLLRISGEEDKARKFLYNIFFFKSPRNHIFVCILLDVWPQIFRWTGYRTQEAFQQGLLDPCMDTVVWSIFNTGPATSLRDLKVGEAKMRLGKECGVRPPQGIRALDHCAKLLGQVQSRPRDEDFKASTSRALVLLSRSQDYRWTHNHLVNSLLELFKKETDAIALCNSGAGGDAESHRLMLLWIIELLGKVARLYPVDARDQCITPLHKSIEGFLVAAGDARMENACLRALLGCGHHLQVQVAMFLSRWKPRFSPLGEETMRAVCDFVGTRGRKFGEKTISVQRKKKIFAH